MTNERITHTWLATCRSTSPIGNVSADSFKCCLTALSRFCVVSSLLSTPCATPSMRRTSDNLRSRRAWHDRNANCILCFIAEAKQQQRIICERRERAACEKNQKRTQHMMTKNERKTQISKLFLFSYIEMQTLAAISKWCFTFFSSKYITESELNAAESTQWARASHTWYGRRNRW